MKENDLVYIKHILEAIDKIERYLGSVSYVEFSKNDMIIDAVVRELEVIGEAAGNISKELKNKNPELPWRESSDMRNFLIHEYFGVNAKTVWDTCKVDLPGLKKQIENLA
jgi:uncharacterized protein with HEPN domain